MRVGRGGEEQHSVGWVELKGGFRITFGKWIHTVAVLQIVACAMSHINLMNRKANQIKVEDGH